MQDTVLIIGDSPFLSEIQDKIQYLINRHYSIGINRIVNIYNTNCHAFTDMNLISITNKHQDMKTITLDTYYDLIKKERKLKDLYPSMSFTDTKKLYNSGRLAWCGFTHDYVISYCILKRFKRIILIGAADFTEGVHYSCQYNFTYSDILKRDSKEFIENYCTKYAEILTCNPNSILNIPRISVDELLR